MKVILQASPPALAPDILKRQTRARSSTAQDGGPSLLPPQDIRGAGVWYPAPYTAAKCRARRLPAARTRTSHSASHRLARTLTHPHSLRIVSTCDITHDRTIPRAPLTQGARRSLEHDVSRRRASCCRNPDLAARSPRPSPASPVVTRTRSPLASHRPASRRCTCADRPPRACACRSGSGTLASQRTGTVRHRAHTSTPSFPRSAQDYLLGGAPLKLPASPAYQAV